MERRRNWLYRLLQRLGLKPPDEPHPTPGEMAAVFALIPLGGDRRPSEKICLTIWRMGWQARDKLKSAPLFVPVALTPGSGAPVAWGGPPATYEPPPPVTDPYHEVHARLQARASEARRQVERTQRMIRSQENPTRHEIPASSPPPAQKRFTTQRLVPPMSTPAERWREGWLLDNGPLTERREAL